ncbi:triose-phosphate isomerase [Hellea sp.]|nr:triose-phosphate isomerase [Hellea sp.]
MRPLIAGNWKMHGDMSWVEKPAAFEALMPATERKHLDILICPPSLFIAAMAASCHEANILLGAQNCHRAESGAHTGEVSAAMVKSAGAEFVIVGHSERRAGGETDENVATKAMAASKQGVTPIICVGENLDVREEGRAESVVTDQIKASVPAGVTDYVLAYEPIWAIGTGMTATADDIKAMHAVIRGLVGPKVRILYGGSVKPVNAKKILSTENVNGALIGGASLEMESLAAIARAA